MLSPKRSRPPRRVGLNFQHVPGLHHIATSTAGRTRQNPKPQRQEIPAPRESKGPSAKNTKWRQLSWLGFPSVERSEGVESQESTPAVLQSSSLRHEPWHALCCPILVGILHHLRGARSQRRSNHFKRAALYCRSSSASDPESTRGRHSPDQGINRLAEETPPRSSLAADSNVSVHRSLTNPERLAGLFVGSHGEPSPPSLRASEPLRLGARRQAQWPNLESLRSASFSSAVD